MIKAINKIYKSIHLWHNYIDKIKHISQKIMLKLKILSFMVEND